MAIYGIGTDIVLIPRMKDALERFSERFSTRILHPEEIPAFQSSSDAARYLAKRFAAKEAASKAFGTGIACGVSFQDFCIRHDALGKPLLEISGQAQQLMLEHSITCSHLSLSDEEDHVVAFVVLEK